MNYLKWVRNLEKQLIEAVNITFYVFERSDFVSVNPIDTTLRNLSYKTGKRIVLTIIDLDKEMIFEPPVAKPSAHLNKVSREDDNESSGFWDTPSTRNDGCGCHCPDAIFAAAERMEQGLTRPYLSALDRLHDIVTRNFELRR